MLRGNRGRKTERRNEFSGGAVDGTSCGRAPTALRVYGDVPLHFSAVDDGAGAPARLPEDQGAAHGGRALQPRGAILGAKFRDQFCPWRDHRHPDGIPVRDELGGVLQGGRRRHRADAGNGGGLFFFSGVERSGIVPVWREEAWPHWPLVGGGSWLSGYLIVATDAWMQHPMGYRIGANGEIELASFWDLLLNKWALWQYAHNMLGAVQTGCFVMAAVGAFYLLAKRDETYGRTFVRTGVLAGVVAAILQLFPTGDMQGKLVADHQQPTLAAMEGLFESRQGAPLAILGQPDVEKRRLDNPLQVPNMLSFLTYRQWRADVKGLSDFPENQWPDQIPLLYYSYHVMVGLGTIFIAVMVLASLLLWRGKLYDSRWMLWTLMVCFPLPYIANTAGWMTAELDASPGSF